MKSTFYVFLAQSPDCYISKQELRLSFLAATRLCSINQKADVAEHPEEFHHVGLLSNESPGDDRITLYLVVRQLRGTAAILRPRFSNYNDQSYRLLRRPPANQRLTAKSDSSFRK
jgi:hypothetical protein